MLYFMPPYHIINGVCLFRDHADLLQYYYLPVAPKLTRIQDPVTKQRIPQLQLIQYRGEAGKGGFLNFSVNIGVEPEILDDVRSKLRSLERLRQTPKLAPVPLIDGTVKMMLFGRQTGDSLPEGTSPKFVLKIDQAAKPSLYGDNQAVFSVALDAEGVTMLQKALQGEMSPIGIVYSLDYLGLRPAYSVRLNIDWDRVQKHLDERFGIDAWFVSTEIDKVVDELIDNRAIVLEADTFVPEGEDTSGTIDRRDQAVNEVRDMITETFFEPSLDPVKEEKDGWDKAAQFAERVSAIAATGGWGGQGIFKYKKVDYTRIDRKVLNVNMSERTTVKRSIYPQGTLTGLFRILRQEGLDPNKFIIPVDLDDPWFQRRKVKVISRANFEEDSIGSLNVNLRYGNEPKSVILESSTARNDIEWNSILANGAMQRDVIANYKVTFKGVDSTERPLTLVSPDQVVNVENLEIDPRELYAIAYIPVIALSFPWKQYPTVEVQTRYTDEANGIRLADTFLLNEKQPEQTWKMFVRNPQRTKFEYKLIYRAVNHKDVEMPWVETEDERVIVRDPRPNKRSLLVVPNFNWNEINRAFVDLSYEDKKNNISESQSFEFTEADDETKTFSVDLVNPDLRRVKYEVTVLYNDGRSAQIPPSYTLDRRIIVRSDMKGHKIVGVQPAVADFAKKKVKQMTVEIRYEDDSAGLSYADDFTFQSSNERGNFEYDYVDEKKASYEYRVLYRFTNNLSKTTNWTKANAEELIIPVG